MITSQVLQQFRMWDLKFSRRCCCCCCCCWWCPGFCCCVDSSVDASVSKKQSAELFNIKAGVTVTTTIERVNTVCSCCLTPRRLLVRTLLLCPAYRHSTRSAYHATFPSSQHGATVCALTWGLYLRHLTGFRPGVLNPLSAAVVFSVDEK